MSAAPVKVVHLLVADALLCSEGSIISEEWVLPSMLWGATCEACLAYYKAAVDSGDVGDELKE